MPRDPQSPFEHLLAGLRDEELDEQEREYEKEISRLNVFLSAVRAAKDARGVLRGADPPQNERRVSQIDAVLAVMGRDAQRKWTVDELLLAVSRVGAPPGGKNPKNSILATLSRMVDERLVVRLDRGHYALPLAAPVRATPADLGWAPSQGDGDA